MIDFDDQNLQQNLDDLHQGKLPPKTTSVAFQTATLWIVTLKTNRRFLPVIFLKFQIYSDRKKISEIESKHKISLLISDLSKNIIKYET